MSQLGKYLLYAAVAGALAALVAGGLIIKKRWDEAAILLQNQQIARAAEADAKKAKAAADEAQQAKADDDKQLADAQSKVTDLNSQLQDAQSKAKDAQSAVDSATANAKAAQAKLDDLNKRLNNQSPEDLQTALKKAQDDLTAAQSEQKILQDQLDADKNQIATLTDAVNRSTHGGHMPGVSGKVTFVDHAWNFVILDVGLAAGVVPNGELIVYRGRTFLGKVRVTKVDPNDSVAEILPDAKGDIQIGDAVLN